MTKAENLRFHALRKKVMDAVKEQLEYDGHCKSYEGAFEVTVCYPNYFEDENASQGPAYYVITLHCYVLGPHRHYDWHGKTFAEALRKAEDEINSWLGGADND